MLILQNFCLCESQLLESKPMSHAVRTGMQCGIAVDLQTCRNGGVLLSKDLAETSFPCVMPSPCMLHVHSWQLGGTFQEITHLL